MRPAPPPWRTADGIDVDAAGATIGGTTTGAANIISGNTDDGVDIDASCLVEGNDIGTNAAGTAAVANGYDGIYVDASGATIGGTTAGAGNIISGNTDDGIDIDASCLVEGNFIGTNAAGTAAVANGSDGIDVDASGATIGGTTTGAGNIISGNTDDGVYIDASCLVEGNDIGTNAAGTAAVANGYDGIDVDAAGATIGGTTAGAGNIISGNTDYGVYIDASCLVEGNDIGTNEAGTAAVANGTTALMLTPRVRHDRRDHGRRRQRHLRKHGLRRLTSMRRAWSRATTSARMRPAPPPWRTARRHRC